MSQHHNTQQRQSSQHSTGQQPQHHQAQGAHSQQGGQIQGGQMRGGHQQRGQQQGGQQLTERQHGSQQATQVQSGQQQGPAFHTANFLPEDVRSTSIEVCNRVLADAVVVHGQVEGAHWNVRGPDFYQLHELFDDVAETLEPHVDEIAERATALGGTARGTVYQAAQQSSLPPLPEQAVDGQQLLQHVAQALSAFDATLYQGMETVEQNGDLDTVDLLNEVSRDVSKSLWFVEAHLQGDGGAQMGQTQHSGPIGQ